jgi:hypothetical protein
MLLDISRHDSTFLYKFWKLLVQACHCENKSITAALLKIAYFIDALVAMCMQIVLNININNQCLDLPTP